MFFSPLEQFQILPVLSLPLGSTGLDFSITNATLMGVLIIFLVALLLFFVRDWSNSHSFYFIPNRYQIIFEV